MTTEQFNEQQRFDILHHKRMVSLFEAIEDKLCMFDKESLARHRSAIINPHEGYNSVDLNDDEYIGELEEFETLHLEEGQQGECYGR